MPSQQKEKQDGHCEVKADSRGVPTGRISPPKRIVDPKPQKENWAVMKIAGCSAIVGAKKRSRKIGRNSVPTLNRTVFDGLNVVVIDEVIFKRGQIRQHSERDQ